MRRLSRSLLTEVHCAEILVGKQLGCGADDGNLHLVNDGSHGDVAGGEVGADFCNDVVLGLLTAANK